MYGLLNNLNEKKISSSPKWHSLLLKATWSSHEVTNGLG